MAQRTPEEWQEYAEMQRDVAEGNQFSDNTLVIGIVVCIAIAAFAAFFSGSTEESGGKEKMEQGR